MDALEYRWNQLKHPDPENGLRVAAGIMSGSCEGCGGCCGRVIPMTDRERARLIEYARSHRVRPHADAHQMCAMLDPETRRCMAYQARPLVCRLWESPTHCAVLGAKPGQPCGLRADRSRLFLACASESRQTDTWELFNIARQKLA